MKTHIQITPADILPLSNIMSGLLASGHFTYDTEYKDEPKLRSYDFGKHWEEEYEDDPFVYKQEMPEALLVAYSLYCGLKHVCSVSPSLGKFNYE